MKKIHQWALEQCGANDTIINAISMLKTEHAERFVEFITGCAINDEDVPQECIHDDKLHKLVRCNYILDEITYRCEESTTKYFTTQVDANKYAENGSYNWDTSSAHPSNEYPIKAVWTRECEHTTWYERWFSWADKPM